MAKRGSGKRTTLKNRGGTLYAKRTARGRFKEMDEKGGRSKPTDARRPRRQRSPATVTGATGGGLHRRRPRAGEQGRARAAATSTDSGSGFLAAGSRFAAFDGASCSDQASRRTVGRLAHRGADGIDKNVVLHRLQQVVHEPGGKHLFSVPCTTQPREGDEWHGGHFVASYFAKKPKPVVVRHCDVGQYDHGRISDERRQRLVRRPRRPNDGTEVLKNQCHDLPRVGVVLDVED
jgi:hypothetical protein